MRPHATAVLARVRSLGVRLAVTPDGLRYSGLPPGRLGSDLLGDLRLVKAEIIASLGATPPLPARVGDDADLATVAQADLATADDLPPTGWVRCTCGRCEWRADYPQGRCRRCLP